MPMLSGEIWASHMAKNLAALHHAANKELGREEADRLVRVALDAAERQTFELIAAADAKAAEIDTDYDPSRDM